MNELSGYVFAPLREGDIALYRGSGNGVEPILLVGPGLVTGTNPIWKPKARHHPLWAAPTVSATRAPRAPMGFGEPVVVSRAV